MKNVILNPATGKLDFCFNNDQSSDVDTNWNLVVGSTSLSFTDASLRINSVLGDCYVWDSTGLTWTDGDMVSLEIQDGPSEYTNLIPPAPPQAVAIGVDGSNPNTGLAVTWTLPDNTGRPPITDYDIRHRPDGTSETAGTGRRVLTRA